MYSSVDISKTVRICSNRSSMHERSRCPYNLWLVWNFRNIYLVWLWIKRIGWFRSREMRRSVWRLATEYRLACPDMCRRDFCHVSPDRFRIKRDCYSESRTWGGAEAKRQHGGWVSGTKDRREIRNRERGWEGCERIDGGSGSCYLSGALRSW